MLTLRLSRCIILIGYSQPFIFFQGQILALFIFSQQNMTEKSVKKPESIRQLVLSVAAYSSGSIFGPLLVFGGIGYFLFRITESKLILIISIFIAFVVTNIMIVRKIKQMMKEMKDIEEKEKEVK